VGFAAGAIGALPMNLPLLKGASVVGVFWGDHARREPEANARMLDELIGMLRTGALKPPIDQVMPMAQLKAAYARMDERKVMGKLIVRNG
jgi:NADPH2:quinone reductase